MNYIDKKILKIILIYFLFYFFCFLEGYGEYFWVNGSFFKGFFKNGLRHGHGIWKRGPGNSDFYEGEYINDKK
jgi:hypothetical protein